ncbi:MAG: PaaI family thioesterase [Clostridia bacterium]|nr:PaaI family thioesterase [Clostridia bacterium]
MELEQIRERFSKDLYAVEATGITVAEAGDCFSVCELALGRRHKNAMGGVMGGAIFTLCDFAYAVASNGLDKPYSMALSSSISFLAQPKTEKLTARAECVRDGGHTCFYRVRVEDSAGNAVAEALFTGYKLK